MPALSKPGTTSYIHLELVFPVFCDILAHNSNPLWGLFAYAPGSRRVLYSGIAGYLKPISPLINSVE